MLDVDAPGAKSDEVVNENTLRLRKCAYNLLRCHIDKTTL